MPTVKAHVADATARDGTEEGAEDLDWVDAIALAYHHCIAMPSTIATHIEKLGQAVSSSRFRTIHPSLLVILRSSLRHLSVGRPV